MTTPQRTFSERNQAGIETSKPVEPNTAHSIYCADCLCGRHFETSSCERVSPDCHRHIVLEWACSQAGDLQTQCTRPVATAEEVPDADPL